MQAAPECRAFSAVVGLLRGALPPRECGSSCGFCHANEQATEGAGEVIADSVMFVSPILPHAELQYTADVVMDKEVAERKRKAIYRKNFHIMSPDHKRPAGENSSSSSNQRSLSTNARSSLGIRSKNLSASKAEKPPSFRYWRVMYGVPSSRKHKKWEDQGVLIVENRNTYVVKNNGGKEVARKLHVSIQDVNELESGQQFIVGSKEIEVMEGISDKSYESGDYLNE
ncbi:hypothetical protein RvY_13984 [Ramazzottius varieornatus]|uniref:Uncharacterized protein n=1 Tax=Ramazzottius varieornatus TaxID=947166 RepID=A0A1D1VUX2_RAMVA|nr:hypothetical protein RvY_13984 [Ramazzottius varieornatus]